MENQVPVGVIPEFGINAYFNQPEQQDPLVEVQIFNRKFIAILDSGSSHSLVGGKVFQTLEKYGVRYHKKQLLVRLANSPLSSDDENDPNHSTLQVLNIPIHFNGYLKIQEFLFYPSLQMKDIILGRDFLSEAGIIMDFSENYWKFSNFSPIPRANPIIKHAFLKSPRKKEMRSGFGIVPEGHASIITLSSIYAAVKGRDCWNCTSCNFKIYQEISQEGRGNPMEN